MHTVELLDELLQLAERLGYGVRHEWMGNGGGVCEFRGRRWLFVDLAQTAWEQLQQVSEALRGDPGVYQLPLSAELSRLFEIRRAA
jgi:hypothetical protein